MHIMEGFLPLEWCLLWFAISLPIVAWGAMKVIRTLREYPEQKMMLAVSGAFVFVLSSLKLPSVTGSSSHPTGTGATTMLYGVAVTSIMSVIVLLFQSVLLAHGGLTTLGANVFSMGIAGPAVAYAVFKVMQKAKIGLVPTVFVVATLADLATYMVTALQLALAYPTAGSVLSSLITFLEVFAITQIPLAIVEGILMVMFFDYLAKVRPDLMEGKIFFKKKTDAVEGTMGA